MQFALREVGIAKHRFEFGKRVGVATRRPAEHHQTESRGLWGRNAVGIGYELQSHSSPAVDQGAVDFAQECFASFRIE